MRKLSTLQPTLRCPNQHKCYYLECQNINCIHNYIEKCFEREGVTQNQRLEGARNETFLTQTQTLSPRKKPLPSLLRFNTCSRLFKYLQSKIVIQSQVMVTGTPGNKIMSQQCSTSLLALPIHKERFWWRGTVIQLALVPGHYHIQYLITCSCKYGGGRPGRSDHVWWH